MVPNILSREFEDIGRRMGGGSYWKQFMITKTLGPFLATVKFMLHGSGTKFSKRDINSDRLIKSPGVGVLINLICGSRGVKAARKIAFWASTTPYMADPFPL